mgnify:CR=1 FL=1
MKTSYFKIHENTYKRKRQNGEKGWSTDTVKKRMLNQILIKLNTLRISELKILEIGCGNGGLSIELFKRGFNIKGVDVSAQAIKWAKEKSAEENLEIDFQQANVLSLPYEDNSFNLVIDSLCLHCIIGKDRSLLFNEIKRILKPESFMLGFTMCGDPPEEIKPHFDFETRNMVIDDIAGRYIGELKSLIKEFKNNGFTVIDYKLKKFADDQDELFYLLKKKA